MLEILQRLGLPKVSASTQGPGIDNIISLTHWLMLILFIGWGIFFIYTLIRFRASNNPKADYKGVRNHYSSYLEATVAIIEVGLLFGFAFPIWASRVNDVPTGPDAIEIRVIGQQFAWNIHYPGPDGVFGTTSVNEYWIEEHFEGVAKEFLLKLKDAMMIGNHNNSDIMTDYFDVGWYIKINVGKWDKPYEVTA